MALRIVTDSTADLPKALVQELGIVVIPLRVHFGEATFYDGVDLVGEEFFQRLAQSPRLPTTSQPSAGEFQQAYEPLLQEGHEIVSVHISSKLSGTINSANLARQTSGAEERIEIVDSLSASMGLGLTVLAAAWAVREGASRTEVLNLAASRIQRTQVLLFVDTLEYLQKGGRIGRAQAFLGTLLNVKPLLTVREGEIHPVERVRTRQKALDRLHEFVMGFGELEDLAVLHSTTPEEAEALAERLAVTFPRERTILATYGPTIGTHLGPGGVGVVLCPQAAA